MLPEIASGSLPEADKRQATGHLMECAACSGEVALVRNLRSLSGSLQPRIAAVLPELRGRIRDAAGRQARETPHRAFFPRFPAPRILAWSTGSLTLAGLLALFLVARSPETPPSVAVLQAEGPDFTMTLLEEGLVIEWEKNGNATHKVFRSSSPVDFTRASVALVRGPRWVDTNYQAPGTVYFYKVE